MVLLEDEDYHALKAGADKSEHLEKEKLALQILAREKTVQAEAAEAEAKHAKAEIDRLKLVAQRLEHDNKILMEHYALARHRQFGPSSERTPVGQEQMLFDKAEACSAPDAQEPEIAVAAHTRTKKPRGKREIDLSKLPVKEICHYQTYDPDRRDPSAYESLTVSRNRSPPCARGWLTHPERCMRPRSQ